MQISMEILSQLTSRTDSGAGVKQRAGPDSRAGSRFDKLLDEAITVSGDKTSAIAGPKTKNEPYAPPPVKVKEPVDNTDEALNAGVTANQAMVVIILEGDMETTNIPETLIDVAAVSAIPEDSQNRNTGADFNTGPAQDARPENIVADPTRLTDDAYRETKINGASDLQAAENRAEANGIATVNTTKTEASDLNSGNETAGVTGDIMARTPIRTSQNQRSEDDNSKSSENGDPRPLENENDTTPVKAQKGKQFSDLIHDFRKIDEGLSQNYNSVPPPLADGLKPEQFRADQQMRQTIPDAPVKAENLFDEMISRIETMQSDTKSSMTIQLKPEFLGKVALSISIDATGLHVKINAESGDVRSMINGQINSLIESLQNKGIAVAEVEVAYTGVDNGAFKESREGQAGQDRPRRYSRDIETIDGATYYAALNYDMLDYYLDTEVSSVEYRV